MPSFLRRGWGRQMLLPLPLSEVRAISLENNLGLVALRGGHGNADLLTRLLRTLYLSYFIHEALNGRIDLEPFRETEDGLLRRVDCRQCNEGWSPGEADSEVIEQILAIHDQQLLSLPAHRIAAARERLRRFIEGSPVSPVPRDLSV